MPRALPWLAAAWLLCAPAHAGPSALEQQTAQSLFDEGRALLRQGHTAEACARFADSQRLDPGGGTLLNLAACHEKLGRLATAYTEYSEALSLAISAHRADRQRTASAALAALAPRLPRLRLRVDAPPPDLVVTLDDQPLPPALWGQATPVDPGPHRLAARAPGHLAFATSLDLREGVTNDLALPPLARDPAAAPAAVASSPPAAPPAALVAASPPPTATPPPCPDGRPAPCAAPPPWRPAPSSPVRTAAAIVSVTSLTVALTFGLTAYGTHRAAGCDADARRCPDQDALDTARRARTFAWVSTVGTGIGAATGLLYLLWPDPPARLDVSLAPRSAALTLGSPW
jgi:hypothetical protein